MTTAESHSHASAFGPASAAVAALEVGAVTGRRSEEAAVFARTVDVVDAAAAELGMVGMRADVMAVMPAAHALRRRAGHRADEGPGDTVGGVNPCLGLGGIHISSAMTLGFVAGEAAAKCETGTVHAIPEAGELPATRATQKIAIVHLPKE